MADFDLNDYEKYLAPKVSAETQNKIDLLDSKLRVDRLNEREIKFIGDVKKRIRYNRNLTDKQKQWLAKILIKCQTEQLNI